MLPKKWEELQEADVFVGLVGEIVKYTWDNHEALQLALKQGKPVIIFKHEKAQYNEPNPLPDGVLLITVKDAKELGVRMNQLMDLMHSELGSDEITFTGDQHAHFIHNSVPLEDTE